jgi:hypothetical protein
MRSRVHFGCLNRLNGMQTRFAGLTQLAASLILVGAPSVAGAQQGALRAGFRQAEAEVWARLEQRARRLGALMLDSSQLDLRIPIEGEPEEVIGVTRLTNTSLAVATARLEPLDSIGSPQDPFYSGRYDLRMEDRAGNCLVVHQIVRVDTTTLVRQKRTVESCRPLYMAEVVRRTRRLARIPLSAGQLTDSWSVAPATMAFVDVYMDSVVVLTTKLQLQANRRADDTTTAVRVDSISVGLALGQGAWSIVRKGSPIVVDTTLRRGEMWERKHARFMIPIDSTFALTRSWPVVEVSLSVPITESNPYGFAWTYAHGPRAFFRDVRFPLER